MGIAKSLVETSLPPEFLGLLYPIAKIVFLTARIIASLDFISVV